jgi:hypothetical protein
MKLPAVLLLSAVAVLVAATSTFGQSPPADTNPPAAPEKKMTPGVGWSDAAQSNKPEKTNTTTHSKKKTPKTDAGVPPSAK